MIEVVFASVTTESIHLQVTNAIRAAIVSGQFKLGEKLSEFTLAQQFGISRTPVREALKQLQQEGLVEIIPRVGTCVAKPTMTEVSELFTVKEVLEGLAAGLLAERGNVKELEELQQAMDDMDKAVTAGDTHSYVEANDRFHDAIIRGSNNSKLQSHFNLLINQLPYRRFVYLTLDQPERLNKSVEEHRRVLDAIKSKNFQTAEQKMREHVTASRSKLMQIMEEVLLES